MEPSSTNKKTILIWTIVHQKYFIFYSKKKNIFCPKQYKKISKAKEEEEEEEGRRGKKKKTKQQPRKSMAYCIKKTHTHTKKTKKPRLKQVQHQLLEQPPKPLKNFKAKYTTKQFRKLITP